MGRSQETYNKKEVKNKKDKKRKEKDKKRELRKAEGKKSTFEEMIAYADEYGRLSSVPSNQEKVLIASEDIEISTTRNKASQAPAFLRKGVVISFNEAKGFGFIREIGTNESYFVHANNLEDRVKENDKVIFVSGKGAKGPAALKVKLSLE